MEIESDKIFNPSELIEYFEKIQLGKINFHLDHYLQFIDLHFRHYTGNYNEEISMKNKDILMKLYYDTLFWVGIWLERKEYKYSLYILLKIESYIRNMYYHKVICYKTYIEYYCKLIYLQSILNEEQYALLHCTVLLDDLFLNYKDKKIEINKNNEERNEGYNEFNYCVEKMIGISKIAQSMATKTGLNDYYGKYYFYEKYFTEKSYFNFYDPIPFYKIISPIQWHVSGNRVIHGIMDEKKKGFRKVKQIFRLLGKGTFLYIFRKISKYGENPFKLLVYALLTILIFTFIYVSLLNNPYNNFFDSFYFSFLTFTTFGLSDVNIKYDLYTKICLMIEISLGIVFINGFIVLLARKILR